MTLAAAVAAGPVLAAAAPAQATAVFQVVARYTFDAGLPGGLAADDSGRGGGPLTVVARHGGTVRSVPGISGAAAAFPVGCGGECPRAVLEGRDDDALDPGTRPVRFGAHVLMRAEQTTDGSNVVQKGVWSSDSQWKLQVDGAAGRPSCAMMGTAARRIYSVTAPLSVADGRWHQVTCERIGTALRIVVDGITHGQVAVPSTLSVSNPAPLRVGGNGLSPTSDRFHGTVDDVFVATA